MFTQKFEVWTIFDCGIINGLKPLKINPNYHRPKTQNLILDFQVFPENLSTITEITIHSKGFGLQHEIKSYKTKYWQKHKYQIYRSCCCWFDICMGHISDTIYRMHSNIFDYQCEIKP